jgi:hypothetical protein
MDLASLISKTSNWMNESRSMPYLTECIIFNEEYEIPSILEARKDEYG